MRVVQRLLSFFLLFSFPLPAPPSSMLRELCVRPSPHCESSGAMLAGEERSWTAGDVVHPLLFLFVACGAHLFSVSSPYLPELLCSAGAHCLALSVSEPGRVCDREEEGGGGITVNDHLPCVHAAPLLLSSLQLPEERTARESAMMSG